MTPSGAICELDSLVKPGQVLRLYRIDGVVSIGTSLHVRMYAFGKVHGHHAQRTAGSLQRDLRREWVEDACEHGTVFGGGV